MENKGIKVRDNGDNKPEKQNKKELFTESILIAEDNHLIFIEMPTLLVFVKIYIYRESIKRHTNIKLELGP